MNNETQSDSPCQECGLVERLADHRGRMLCYDHWHAAREQETPYVVVKCWDESEDIPCIGVKAGPQEFLYGDYCYLKEEAEERAAELQSKSHGAQYQVRATGRWFGDRRSHPGFMARRRASIVAEHPEYK